MAIALEELDAPAVPLRWWLCERCGRKLGKLIGQTVIIEPRPGRTIIIPLSSGVTSRCRCGHTNTPQPD